YLAAIIRVGADAVIVQDLGIARLVQAMAPGFAVHGSTQMTLTEPRGIEFVRRLGVERVIVARELSIAEIDRIAQGTTLPLEVFVHGALCVAYSGQCLTSEALGGRSANRGQCAQACRQPYELIVDGQKRDLVDKAYLLSPQDLAAWELVPELTRAGVCSLKIEGRLKSAHYVAATTQAYRAAIDAAAAEQPFELSHQQQLDLAQSFSRGFSHGFLSGVNHQELVQGRFPKHRGVKIGTVAQAAAGEVLVALAAEHLSVATLPLKPGDGVVFDEGRPEQDEQGGRVFAVREVATTGGTRGVALTFGRGDVNLKAIAGGAMVWRTDDPALRRRLEQSYALHVVPQRVPLAAVVRGAPGQPLSIEVSDDAGHTVTVATPVALQQAQKHPITLGLIQEQFGRLGGTPFHLARVELRDLADSQDSPITATLPVMVPKSVLNDLRRQAVALLETERQRNAGETAVDVSALERLRVEIVSRHPSPATGSAARPVETPGLSVLCRTIDQVTAVLEWRAPEGLPGLERVDCDFEEVRRSAEAVRQCRNAAVPVALATPRVIKPSEEGLLLQVAKCEPNAVLVRNLAAVGYFQEKFPGLPLYGDYSLNVANELTTDLLTRHGLTRLVPSYDLNLEQLFDLLSRFDPGRFEVVMHQHVPMFHMEHCVFSHVMSNGKDFHDCGRPCDRHQVELRDHVGEAHPLVADVGCRNTVFSARAQSAAPYVPRLLERGVRHLRVELLREDAGDTQALLTQYALVLAGRS
ncbi:MAG: U32 family peptidase, partial [Planctomycetaceae bacterium]